MPDLTLERRDQNNETVTFTDAAGKVAASLTPFVSESYWAYRVRLSKIQAIVGFPKFSTVGIGFAVEDDWNANLPYTCGVEEIWKHIAHNKSDDAISDGDCVEAIRMVRAAIAEDRIEHEHAEKVKAFGARRDTEDALTAEVVPLRVEAAPSVPSLTDAPVGTVVRTADEVALPGGGGTAEQARDLAGRRFVRVQDGGRTGWVSCDPDRVVITFWATSDLLFALGAIFISVPREVGHA